MTQLQKIILAFLSLTACVLVAVVGYDAYIVYADYYTRPLGAPLPLFTPQELPPTWTPTLGTPYTSLGAVTLAPTLVLAPTNTPAPVCGGAGVTTVLAVGSDSRMDNYQYGLADIIRVVRIDFSNRKVTSLEFPRDLWVEIPYISDNINGQDHEKLNQAYLYGQPGDGFKYWDDPSRGPGLLALTLNLNFGVVTNHYVAVTMQTFVNVVNAVDGIDVNITDYAQADKSGLTIGHHHLNGAEALKVSRDREQGVFARVDNQNLVMCALRKKLTSPTVVTKIPDLINSFKNNIFTDLSPQQISQFACLGTQLQPGSISFVSFPQELFKQDRIYDPVFKKRVFIWDVDFNALRDYVTRFQAGTWPSSSDPTAQAGDQHESGMNCQ